MNMLEVVGNEDNIVYNGRNIVVKHVIRKEIGYDENSKENPTLLKIVDTGQLLPSECIEIEEADIGENRDEGTDTKDSWSSSSIEKMLQLYLENIDKFRNTRVKKRSLWEMIAVQVGKTADSCDKKFRNLKLTYVRTLKKKQESGRHVISWKYFDMFDEIFQGDVNLNHQNDATVVDTLSPAFPTTSGPTSITYMSVDGEPASTSSSEVNYFVETPIRKKRRKNIRSYLNERFKNLERRLEDINQSLRQANAIQEERNELFKQYLQKLD